jgi:hypothetical protein
MYIDWDLRSGFQAFDRQQDINEGLGELLGADSSGNLDSFIRAITANSEFSDRELDQAWRIAQMGEEGANTRAGISAGASRYSADASTRNASIAAKTQRYGIDMERLTAKERLQLDRDLGQGELGLSALELPTKYRGPNDYFQASDMMRGLDQRQDVPAFIQSLMGTGALPGFQAPGGSPDGFSLQNVMNRLLGPGNTTLGATDGQNASALEAMRALAAKGLHTLPQGSLERLSPSELGLLQSGVEYSGDGGPAWNWQDLLGGYKAAQVGQGNPMAA